MRIWIKNETSGFNQYGFISVKLRFNDLYKTETTYFTNQEQLGRLIQSKYRFEFVIKKYDLCPQVWLMLGMIKRNYHNFPLLRATKLLLLKKHVAKYCR